MDDMRRKDTFTFAQYATQMIHVFTIFSVNDSRVYDLQRKWFTCVQYFATQMVQVFTIFNANGSRVHDTHFKWFVCIRYEIYNLFIRRQQLDFIACFGKAHHIKKYDNIKA